MPEEALSSLHRIVAEAGGLGHAGIVLEITVYFAHTPPRPQAGEGPAVLERGRDAAGEDAVFLGVPIDTRPRYRPRHARPPHEAAAWNFERALTSARQQSLLFEQLLILRRRQRGVDTPTTHRAGEDLDETRRLAQILGLEP